MQIVYIDILFFINTAVTFLLLHLTSRLGAATPPRWRLFLGSCLGGIFSVFLFFAPSTLVYNIIFKPLLCWGIVAVAFGRPGFKDLLRILGIFIFVSLCLGGCIFALSFLGFGSSSMSNGVIYFPMSYALLIGGGGATYLFLTIVMGFGGMPKSGELAEISCTIGTHNICFTAMVDTGNGATEPITGQKVILLSPDMLKDIITDEPCEGIKLYAVPITTVSGNDMIYAVKPDHLVINGQVSCQYLIGKSPADIRGKQSAKGIIGGL